MDIIWTQVLANAAIILFTILAWTNLPQRAGAHPLGEQLTLGLVFAVGAVMAMTRPIDVDHGVFVDLRTIPVSIAGLAGGWPGALVAVTLSAAYRLWLGGPGAFAGVAVILLAAAIGVCHAFWLRGRPASCRVLIVFSVLVCLGNLGVLWITPKSTFTGALHQSPHLWLATVFLTTFLSSLAVFAELGRREAARLLKLYEAVIQSLPESLNVKDQQGRFVLANPATARLMKVATAEALIGRTDHDFFPAELADAFRADEREILEGRDAKTIEQEIVFDDGSRLFLSTLKASFRDERGELLGIITHNRDVTERKQLSKALAESEKRAKLALSSMADGLVTFDSQLNLVFCNDQYRAMFPVTADIRVSGAPARHILETAISRGEFADIPSLSASSFIEEAMSRLKRGGVVQFPLRDGRWVESRVTPSEDGGCVVVCSDITLLKKNEQTLLGLNKQLSELAMTDSLTGLLNRRAFDAALSADLSDMSGCKETMSVLLIDVDCFKAYNDTYGHTAGDDCLRQVARAVRSTARRPRDKTARYGGEEMAIILPGTSVNAAQALAEDLRQQIRAMAVPHSAAPRGIVTASIGVCGVGPEDIHLTATQVLDRADEALYLAKASGRDTVCVWRGLA